MYIPVRPLAAALFTLVLLASCVSSNTQGTSQSSSTTSSEAHTKPVLTQVPKISKEETFYADGFSSGSIQYSYDENGDLLREDQFDGKKALLQVRLYTRQADGKKVEIAIQTAVGSPLGFITKEYDSNGNLVRETLSNANKEIQSSSEYTWNANNQLLAWLSRDQKQSVVARTLYTVKDGKTTAIEVQDPSGVLIKRFDQNFDKDGQLVSKIETDPKGTVVSRIVYSYTNGKLAREDYQNGNGAPVRSVVYSYDDKGSPIQLQFLDKKGTLLETRTQQFQIFSRTEMAPQ